MKSICHIDNCVKTAEMCVAAAAVCFSSNFRTFCKVIDLDPLALCVVSFQCFLLVGVVSASRAVFFRTPQIV